ncbi:ABC-2 type transport system permease protein [Nannocystis exedens]|uniref:ABC-2 type transport system permease protein n=2 Tax=Nannocystis exedens TaxID=54 RepID=A0A1I1ZKN4_9BACT|nr:hypothetical protein NAEX_08558 [Nannocystis exedens]SFE32249.1 ABC-2 type transport system permease protein [Nannocystis exedens]
MQAFTGTGALIRLLVRRDRGALALWIAVMLAFPPINAAALARMFASTEQMQAFVRETEGNLLIVAFHGPIHAATGAGLVAWRSLLQVVFAAALGSMLFVIRHTRAEEDAGRRELVGAGAVGRLAGLTAALAVVIVADVAAAALLAGLLALVVGFPVAGSIAFAATLAAAGALFAGLAAVAGEVASSATSARKLAIGAFAGLWAVRMLGNAGEAAGGPGWVSWLSPLGWAGEVRAYADERWAVFGLFAAATVGVVALAYGLAARRDLGAGLLALGTGPDAAGRGLRGLVGLAWRLQRGPLLLATLALALIGAALGGIGAGFAEGLEASPSLAAWLAPLRGATLGDAFLALMLYVLVALVGAAHGVAAVLRGRAEETRGHLTWILATSASRTRWLGSHVGLALAGPPILALAAGLSAGSVDALTSGREERAAECLGLALTHVPAAWVMIGLATALFGRFPRAAGPLAWGVLALFTAQVALWEAGAITRPWLNPFTVSHPMLALDLRLLAVLGLAAAGLTIAGALAFRARDVG